MNRPWGKRSNSMGRNRKVFRLREPKHIVLWEAVLEIYGENPDRGHISTDLLDVVAIRLATPALVQTHTDDDITEGIQRILDAKLLESDPEGGYRLVGYDETYWPGCSRCHKPNPDDRFSKCPTCRGSDHAAQGATTACDRDPTAGHSAALAAPGHRNGRARAAPGQRRGSDPAQQEEKRREEKRVPSLPSQNGSAEAAPQQIHGGEREADSDSESEAPEREVLDLERELILCGWHTQQGRFARRKAVRALIAEQGLTVDDVKQLWPLAKAKGDVPAALLATWVDRRQWKDVLAEQRMHEKEAGLAKRAASNGQHTNVDPKPIRDLGPIYDERKTT